MNKRMITPLVLSTKDTDYNFLKISFLGSEINMVSDRQTHTHNTPTFTELTNFLSDQSQNMSLPVDDR